MTRSSYSVGCDQSLEVAHAMMRRYGIRHLPVLECGRLAGIVSARDLYIAESLPGVDARFTRVKDAMSQPTYRVHPEARIEDVAREMAEGQYGCAVVMAGDRVCGIFTTTDALRALSELWRSSVSSSGPRAAGSRSPC